jgi:hypothetical protein
MPTSPLPCCLAVGLAAALGAYETGEDLRLEVQILPGIDAVTTSDVSAVLSGETYVFTVGNFTSSVLAETVGIATTCDPQLGYGVQATFAFRSPGPIGIVGKGGPFFRLHRADLEETVSVTPLASTVAGGPPVVMGPNVWQPQENYRNSASACSSTPRSS